MSTTTATRTLRDVMAERVANGKGVGVNTPLDFNASIGDMVGAMAFGWYNDDQRASEVEWLDGVLSDAREAAEEASIDAAVAVLAAALRQLADGGGPAHLLDQATDELRADLAQVEEPR